MKYLIATLTLLMTLNAHALINAEAEGGLSSIKRKGQSQESDGSFFRLGASLAFLPFINFDAKLGRSTGETDDTVVNSNGQTKPLAEHETNFFGAGLSFKPINLLRVGAGLVYQMSEHTLNSSTTSNQVVEDNDLGYYLDGGLYTKWGLVGLSLTYTYQKAGDVDGHMIGAGVIVGL